MRIWWDGMPESVRREIAVEGLRLQLLDAPETPIQVAHVFATGRADLEAKLERLLPLLDPAGMIWVSWPKKASKVPTDITEDVIRELCLPMGPGRHKGVRGGRDLVGAEAGRSAAESRRSNPCGLTNGAEAEPSRA